MTENQLNKRLGKEIDNLHLTVEDLRDQLARAEARLEDASRRMCDLCTCDCGSDSINHENYASWCDDCGRIVVQDGSESGEFIWIDPVTYEFPEGTVDVFDHFYGHHDWNTAGMICELWNNESAQERRQADHYDPNYCEHGCGRLSTAADCECQI
jgi:hypothetical protein